MILLGGKMHLLMKGDCGGGVVVDVWYVCLWESHGLDTNHFLASSIVQIHPVVFIVFKFASVSQCFGE